MRYLMSILMLLFACSAVYAQEEAKENLPSMEELLTLTEQDIVEGERDAPVTVIEYSSYSCNHCASFHEEVYPKLKEKFIDTGKIAFTNRAYPLNEPALAATKLVSCTPEDNKLKMQHVLFELQKRWAFTPSYKEALKKIAAVGGVGNEAFEACMDNSELEEKILQERLTAGQVLPIRGTPSIFINGELLAGNTSYPPISAMINAAIDEMDEVSGTDKSTE